MIPELTAAQRRAVHNGTCTRDIGTYSEILCGKPVKEPGVDHLCPQHAAAAKRKEAIREARRVARERVTERFAAQRAALARHGFTVRRDPESDAVMWTADETDWLIARLEGTL